MQFNAGSATVTCAVQVLLLLEASEAVTVTVKVLPTSLQLNVAGVTEEETTAQLSVKVEVTSLTDTVTVPFVPMLAVKFWQTRTGSVKSMVAA